MTKVKASVPFTDTISPIDTKVVESQEINNKNVENMFDDDGKEQGGEEEEGKKRKETYLAPTTVMKSYLDQTTMILQEMCR